MGAPQSAKILSLWRVPSNIPELSQGLALNLRPAPDFRVKNGLRMFHPQAVFSLKSHVLRRRRTPRAAWQSLLKSRRSSRRGTPHSST